MSLHVESKVVRPGESPVAFLALEWPMTRVFPVVASELIGTCKLPAAALPVAVVWLLPCVCAVVCFQVGALCVRFATADVVARVRRHPLPWPGAPAAFGLWLLRQAVRAGDHEAFWVLHGRPLRVGCVSLRGTMVVPLRR